MPDQPSRFARTACGNPLALRAHRSPSHGRIVFLDYLRIFAFVSVLVGHKYHAPIQAAAQAPGTPWHWPARLLWPWVQGGGAGVLVFFLVSGYIITQVLQREDALEFGIKRILRIYPLYITAVLIEYAGRVGLGLGRPPVWSELVPQLLLVGDWTGTYYALGGVEWTLRVEVSFYVFMTVLQLLGLVRWRSGAALPWAYALCLGLLYLIGPFPEFVDWTRGYFTLYAPLLLVGSLFYLFESGTVRWPVLLGFALCTLALHYWGLYRWQPRWLSAHFFELAFFLFALCWGLRQRLPAYRWVLWLSALTYSVYLFHHWFYDWLQAAATGLRLPAAAAAVFALVGLLLVCIIVERLVERPGIRLGRRLVRHWARPVSRGTSPPSH